MEKNNMQGIKKDMVLELNPAIEGGVYSNLANIIHNKNEFIIDFAVVLPGKNAARVQSRIITNPVHAKQLLTALTENIAKYEAVNGEIKIEKPTFSAKPEGGIH